MTTAFLLLSHGTRDETGVAEFLRFRNGVATEIAHQLGAFGAGPVRQPGATGAVMVEHAFLELCAPDLPTAAKACFARGAREIVLVPLLLFAAGHAKRDIPTQVDEARAAGVDVRWTIIEPIGLDNEFVAVAAQRVRQAAYEAKPPTRTVDVVRGWSGARAMAEDGTGLLFIGRGGRDPFARRVALEVAQAIADRTGANAWEPAFLAGPAPDGGEGLRRLAARPGVQAVTVLPYLWFTGRLVRDVPVQLQALCPPGLSLRFTAPLGNHPKLVARVAQRALAGWRGAHERSP